METTKATFYCYFCSRHILITFVGMTLLIVNYGVNTVQMSAVPHRNGNSSNSNSTSNSNNAVLSIDSKNILWVKSIGNIKKINSKRNTNLENIALPGTQRYYKDKVNRSHDSNSSTEFDMRSENLRDPRFFGLLGSNFSLSYNLTLSTGNSAGNITVVGAPAPTAYYYVPAPTAYYYVPKPSYPDYSSNNYYDPYAYNPYANYPYPYYQYDPNNPYAGYTYYG